MWSRRSILTLLALTPGAGLAQEASQRSEASDRAARRFPQPVRVGDLVGRRLIEPDPRQAVLGRVADVVRGPDGAVALVVALGGWWRLGQRSVAVPIDAVALLGEHVALLDLSPDDLRGLPGFVGAGGAIARDERLRVGLARPFH